MPGHINVILGSMYSGKSSYLLDQARRCDHAKQNYLLINNLHNEQMVQGVMTHDKVSCRSINVAELMPLCELACQYSVVLIDEGHLFKDIADFCEYLANRMIIVFVAALDSDCRRKQFNNILDLIPLAEKLVKLTAICVACTKEAAFTRELRETLKAFASQFVETVISVQQLMNNMQKLKDKDKFHNKLRCLPEYFHMQQELRFQPND